MERTIFSRTFGTSHISIQQSDLHTGRAYLIISDEDAKVVVSDKLRADDLRAIAFDLEVMAKALDGDDYQQPYMDGLTPRMEEDRTADVCSAREEEYLYQQQLQRSDRAPYYPNSK
jgi:hypothetical protein